MSEILRKRANVTEPCLVCKKKLERTDTLVEMKRTKGRIVKEGFLGNICMDCFKSCVLGKPDTRKIKNIGFTVTEIDLSEDEKAELEEVINKIIPIEDPSDKAEIMNAIEEAEDLISETEAKIGQVGIVKLEPAKISIDEAVEDLMVDISDEDLDAYEKLEEEGVVEELDIAGEPERAVDRVIDRGSSQDANNLGHITVDGHVDNIRIVENTTGLLLQILHTKSNLLEYGQYFLLNKLFQFLIPFP